MSVTSQVLIRAISPEQLAALAAARRALIPEGEILEIGDYHGAPIVRGVGPSAAAAVQEIADLDAEAQRDPASAAPPPPPDPSPPSPPAEIASLPAPDSSEV